MPNLLRRAPIAPPKSATMRAVALGAFATGALAVGALAIGALAIGRLAVGKAKFRSLEVDELTVRKLRTAEQQRPRPVTEPPSPDEREERAPQFH